VIGFSSANNDVTEELNLQQDNENFKTRGFMERSTQYQFRLVRVSVMWFKGSKPLNMGPKGQYVASGVHTLLVSVYY